MKNNKSNLLKDIVLNKGYIKAIKIDGKANDISRKQIDQLTELAKKNHAKGLLYLKLNNSTLEGPMTNLLSDQEKQDLISLMKLKDQDII